jgi:hypothetical protein
MRDHWVCSAYLPGTSHDGTEGELYDLDDDPLQRHNRWDDPALQPFVTTWWPTCGTTSPRPAAPSWSSKPRSDQSSAAGAQAPRAALEDGELRSKMIRKPVEGEPRLHILDLVGVGRDQLGEPPVATTVHSPNSAANRRHSPSTCAANP